MPAPRGSVLTNAGATLNGSANPGGAAIKTRFDFGPTTAYGTSTPDATIGVTSVVTPFEAIASGQSQGATVHFRAVAKSDFVALDGADQSFTVENTPPDVSIDSLPDKVKIRKLGKGRLLSVGLTVSEPSTVTIQILNKKGTVVKQVVVSQARTGSFTAQISLEKVRRGKLTLRVIATDAGGASSTPAERQFKAR